MMWSLPDGSFEGRHGSSHVYVPLPPRSWKWKLRWGLNAWVPEWRLWASPHLTGCLSRKGLHCFKPWGFWHYLLTAANLANPDWYRDRQKVCSYATWLSPLSGNDLQEAHTVNMASVLEIVYSFERKDKRKDVKQMLAPREKPERLTEWEHSSVIGEVKLQLVYILVHGFWSCTYSICRWKFLIRLRQVLWVLCGHSKPTCEDKILAPVPFNFS